jgi:putative iron-regulated protein
VDLASETAAPVAVPLELTTLDAGAVATTYASLVHASYVDTAEAAVELQTSIRAFTTTPSEATLAAARQTWVTAREVYAPTEAFRFYGGPIDDPVTGPEPRINGWPVDVAAIDYTAETPGGGIVNDVGAVPEITFEALVAAGVPDGERRTVTGWHALEFLLWGEDTSPDGPGARPASDYQTGANAGRRSAYLNLVTDLLVADLVSVRDQWRPDGGGYRAAFLADPVTAVRHILQGMGALSAGELAGARLGRAGAETPPDQEYAGYSDNTLRDIVGNAKGVRSVYAADYEGIEGTSLSEVVARLAPDVDADLRKQLDNNVAAAEALPDPFDQVILADEDDPRRVELQALVDDLVAQGEAIAALAASFGLDISLEI